MGNYAPFLCTSEKGKACKKKKDSSSRLKTFFVFLFLFPAHFSSVSFFFFFPFYIRIGIVSFSITLTAINARQVSLLSLIYFLISILRSLFYWPPRHFWSRCFEFDYWLLLWNECSVVSLYYSQFVDFFVLNFDLVL